MVADPSSWPAWSPPHAPNVVARIEPRRWDDEARKHEPQEVRIACSACGATWQVRCEQGRPREHVMKFAASHLHRDPFAAAPKR